MQGCWNSLPCSTPVKKPCFPFCLPLPFLVCCWWWWNKFQHNQGQRKTRSIWGYKPRLRKQALGPSLAVLSPRPCCLVCGLKVMSPPCLQCGALVRHMGVGGVCVSHIQACLHTHILRSYLPAPLIWRMLTEAWILRVCQLP